MLICYLIGFIFISRESRVSNAKPKLNSVSNIVNCSINIGAGASCAIHQQTRRVGSQLALSNYSFRKPDVCYPRRLWPNTSLFGCYYCGGRCVDRGIRVSLASDHQKIEVSTASQQWHLKTTVESLGAKRKGNESQRSRHSERCTGHRKLIFI